MSDLLAHERERAKELDRAAEQRRERINTRLPEMVSALAAHPEVRRVVLFGSVARGEIRPDSDIDLAVEGLDGMASLHAWLDVEAAARGLPFSLVELERASDELTAQINQDGVTLFERPNAPGGPTPPT